MGEAKDTTMEIPAQQQDMRDQNVSDLLSLIFEELPARRRAMREPTASEPKAAPEKPPARGRATGEPTALEELPAQRRGMRELIASDLRKAVAANQWAPAGAPGKSEPRWGKAQIRETAVAVEREAWKATSYAPLVREILIVIPEATGPYPDDIVAIELLTGVLTPAALVAKAQGTPPEVSPRFVLLRRFVRTLMTGDASFAASREVALEHAKHIEASCFNATIRICKGSERPLLRNWRSEAFVGTYSARCGTVLGLLDPTSASCRAYGDDLIRRLARGELCPKKMGGMSSEELCPRSMAAERGEILLRSEQKVAVKESNMFRCPHCGERRCSYREVQRRSLDEAPDYDCLCLNCERSFAGRG
jgi:DNA-directed RNA polymerase subunit M/transcription elongation factor TFIIS